MAVAWLVVWCRLRRPGEAYGSFAVPPWVPVPSLTTGAVLLRHAAAARPITPLRRLPVVCWGVIGVQALNPVTFLHCYAG